MWLILDISCRWWCRCSCITSLWLTFMRRLTWWKASHLNRRKLLGIIYVYKINQSYIHFCELKFILLCFPLSKIWKPVIREKIMLDEEYDLLSQAKRFLQSHTSEIHQRHRESRIIFNHCGRIMFIQLRLTLLYRKSVRLQSSRANALQNWLFLLI